MGWSPPPVEVIPSVALIASSSSSTAVTNEVSGSADSSGSFGCSVDELSLSLLSAKALKLDVPC